VIEPVDNSHMPQAALRLDFVSDVACPWCAVGLWSLRAALLRVQDEIAVELHFQPFELNPRMAPEGEDAVEHLSRKYGISAAEIARNREGLEARGAAVGFTFAPGGRGRIHNTFDAHRLLHWAGTLGAEAQLALKIALLEAYHSEGLDVSDAAVLERIAGSTGLDVTQARHILEQGRYADEVRAAETQWQEAGIQAVPSLVIDRANLLQGGQPPEVFERAIRQVAGSL
jgi:predicted DsbA family dithiol-disulfide isomerase